MLNSKQKQILEFINSSIENEGFSPSVREICLAVNLKSTSTVQYHLNKLIDLGYINKANNKSRSIRSKDTKNIKAIPILGEISAGQPLLAEENFIGEVTYIKENKNNSLFALKVNGDSMVDAGLFDNDLVIIDKDTQPQNGDIGAFLINDIEATVKYLDTVANVKYLIPANKNYSNIKVDENITSIGKVISLIRDM
tara:strand:+ start:471 stop:1058 length:588 start_codon:yes stop_codon:yes gene_type:complete